MCCRGEGAAASAAGGERRGLREQLSAGDADHLTDDEARVLGREEDVDGCEVARLRRPIGLCSPKRATFSSGNDIGISGVHTGPGATALTRIPFSINSLARPFVNVTIAPLVVA
jgi:hypothetical protein